MRKEKNKKKVKAKMGKRDSHRYINATHLAVEVVSFSLLLPIFLT